MARHVLIAIIKLYQIGISPFYPSRCRFKPSCSEYSIEAIKKYGVFKGCFLGFKRILKCRSNGSHGFDPLEKK